MGGRGGTRVSVRGRERKSFTPLPLSLSRSPRKGLMSPKAFVANDGGGQTRQVFGFDAPYDPESRVQCNGGQNGVGSNFNASPLCNGLAASTTTTTTHTVTGFEQPPGSQGVGELGGPGVATPSQKSQRKSSPPINTPLNIKRH